MSVTQSSPTQATAPAAPAHPASPPRPAGAIPRREALLLGAVQGLAEPLPVSSSAHLAAVPRALGMTYAHAPPDLRKAFEVATHAGAAAGIALADRRALRHRVRGLRGLATSALSFAPAATAGYLFEGPIERRLGGPRTAAAGLVAGSALLLVAERLPGSRSASEAGPLDGLALGLLQATALIPGVSRSAATTAAARIRGFSPSDAAALSRESAVPIIAGAAVLKGVRTVRGGAAGDHVSMAAGALAAGVSAALAARALRGRAVPARAAAAYRLALAAGLIASRQRAPSAASPMLPPR